MSVALIDPVSDPAWRTFIAAEPNASVFHSPEWLRALERTYRYEPVAFVTREANGRITNGAVFCRIDSWLTGRRLVSLPFSDHCQPLATSPLAWQGILAHIRERDAGGVRYVEIRPIELDATQREGLGPAGRFCFHHIDLTDTLDAIQARFHTTSVKQMLRRAEREKLECSTGRDNVHLDWFYQLQVRTRQRHGVPPPPRHWFANVLDTLGDAATIRVAFKDGTPAASILTLAHKRVHYYKYGGSDQRFSRLGGTQLLLWTAIREAKCAGADRFDMGRSDPDNAGLIEFKDRWGAQRREICYYRWPPPSSAVGTNQTSRLAHDVFRRLPGRLQQALGHLLYEHAG